MTIGPLPLQPHFVRGRPPLPSHECPLKYRKEGRSVMTFSVPSPSRRPLLTFTDSNRRDFKTTAVWILKSLTTLIFLSLLFFGKSKENHPKRQGFFFSILNPKILGKRREKRSKKQGNSLQRKKQGISLKARKGRSGNKWCI